MKVGILNETEENQSAKRDFNLKIAKLYGVYKLNIFNLLTIAIITKIQNMYINMFISFLY